MRKNLKFLLRLVTALVILAIFAAMAALGFWLARERIAETALRAFLPHGDGFANTFAIKRLDFGGIEIADARMGGFPFAPSFKSLRVKWTMNGLIKSHRIDSIDADGISFDASHRVPGFAMPSLGKAGLPPPSRDVLQGWTIGRISARTGQLDFAPLLGTNMPESVTSAANGTFTLSGGCVGGHMLCGIDGVLARQPIKFDVDYSPFEAKGTASLEWRIVAADLGLTDRIQLRAVTGAMDFAFAEARGIDCSAEGHLSFEPCKWKVPLKFSLSPDGKFSFSSSLTALLLNGEDPLVQTALAVAKAYGAQLPGELSFSGELGGAVEVSGGAGAPPSWNVNVHVSDLSLSLTGAAVPMSLNGGRVRGAAAGCGSLVKIEPCSVGFDGASIGIIPFGRGRATIVADEKTVVVSEAAVGFCGGFVRLYALYLNIEKLSAGFTLYLDNLLLSDALGLFSQLAGSEATGSLHGRLPLRYMGNGEVRLGEGFIYTPPGQTGNLKVKNPEVLTSLLAQAGLPPVVCENVEKALRDIDYDVLRLDLVNPRGEDGRIAIRLQGKSSDGNVVTPVNLSANVNGPIEKFLNMSIRTAKLGALGK